MSRKEEMRYFEGVLAQYKTKIEEKEKELAALKGEMVGFMKAYEMKRKPALRSSTAVPPLRAPRANVKQTVLDLLQEQGAAGLNASTAVELAAKRNESLQQSTVSSLLSRFKMEGITVYDGKVYRLKQFAAGMEGNPMH